MDADFGNPTAAMREVRTWLDREREELIELAGEFSTYVGEFFESRTDHRSRYAWVLGSQDAATTASGELASSA